MPQCVIVFDCPFQSDEVNIDAVSDALIDFGALAVSVQDADRGTEKEAPIFHRPTAGAVEWHPAGRKFWTSVRVEAVFDSGTDIEGTILAIGGAFDLPTQPTYRLVEVKDEDWVRKVQDSFQPLEFDRVWITFPWRDDGGQDAFTVDARGRRRLVLEPGMAFGTGEHATTRLCVRWLESMMNAEAPIKLMLDYGSGSGILALVGAVLGVERVIGVEIDDDANIVARRNAALNNVHNVRFFLPDAEPTELDGRYDITVANILAVTLCELAPTLLAKTNAGGSIALSGILLRQAETVKQCFEMHGGEVYNAEVDDGWVLMIARKKAG